MDTVAPASYPASSGRCPATRRCSRARRLRCWRDRRPGRRAWGATGSTAPSSAAATISAPPQILGILTAALRRAADLQDADLQHLRGHAAVQGGRDACRRAGAPFRGSGAAGNSPPTATQSRGAEAASAIIQRRARGGAAASRGRTKACFSPTRLGSPSCTTSIQPCHVPTVSSGQEAETASGWPGRQRDRLVGDQVGAGAGGAAHRQPDAVEGDGLTAAVGDGEAHAHVSADLARAAGQRHRAVERDEPRLSVGRERRRPRPAACRRGRRRAGS